MAKDPHPINPDYPEWLRRKIAGAESAAEKWEGWARLVEGVILNSASPRR